jgi:glycerol kinase
MKYILAIDQSTSGTKALLLNERAEIIGRSDLAHRQIINEQGWVSHDPMEIYNNTVAVSRRVIEEAGIKSSDVVGVGISNQRETALVWNRETGHPVHDAIVWQCARAQNICDRIADRSDFVYKTTGIPLSPYYSGAKIAWILEHTDVNSNLLMSGTIDSWLLYKLTRGKIFATDYSNASRTQLFNIVNAQWDKDVCAAFGIPMGILPEIRDSNALFGETDMEGLFSASVPIHSVLGDSHAALFGQGCFQKGMTKATYGTGSSVMMNIGDKPVFSRNGLATSLAWSMDGTINYVLEGNINYTGSVIQWVCDLGLIPSPKEAGKVAAQANAFDMTCLVPAFTGLGAPHWNSDARAIFCGITRNTGRAELVRAAEECIAYQIRDVVEAMKDDAGVPLVELRVDGGPTKDAFLMQFQSDMLDIPVSVPKHEELSALGAGYAAGAALGIYDLTTMDMRERLAYRPSMDTALRSEKYDRWKLAIKQSQYK